MPEELLTALRAAHLPEDETGLREHLEACSHGWTLYRLPQAAAKRWKCRYRLMMGAGYFDGLTVTEVYARALLAQQK